MRSGVASRRFWAALAWSCPRWAIRGRCWRSAFLVAVRQLRVPSGPAWRRERAPGRVAGDCLRRTGRAPDRDRGGRPTDPASSGHDHVPLRRARRKGLRHPRSHGGRVEAACRGAPRLMGQSQPAMVAPPPSRRRRSGAKPSSGSPGLGARRVRTFRPGGLRGASRARARSAPTLPRLAGLRTESASTFSVAAVHAGRRSARHSRPCAEARAGAPAPSRAGLPGAKDTHNAAGPTASPRRTAIRTWQPWWQVGAQATAYPAARR